jgi:hypothetical protein
MAAKLVIYNPVVEYRAASAGGSGAFTNVSGNVKEVSLMPKRVRVDVGVFDTPGQSTEKGSSQSEVRFHFLHSADATVFTNILLTELAADGDTEFRFKMKDAATSAANPVYWVKIKLNDAGELGGARDTASGAQLTFPVEGIIQKSVDGTTFTTVV